uniref:Uncharacterized protein n=1 Tax=Rhizophora mucronata TaxID=61149 RepID=A0A2P2QHL9_RHIMU
MGMPPSIEFTNA